MVRCSFTLKASFYYFLEVYTREVIAVEIAIVG